MLGTCSSTNTYMHWEFSNHGPSFRALDSSWPNSDDRDLGKRFYLYLLKRNGNGSGDVKSAISFLFERSGVMVGTSVGNACPF